RRVLCECSRRSLPTVPAAVRRPLRSAAPLCAGPPHGWRLNLPVSTTTLHPALFADPLKTRHTPHRGETRRRKLPPLHYRVHSAAGGAWGPPVPICLTHVTHPTLSTTADQPGRTGRPEFGHTG